MKIALAQVHLREALSGGNIHESYLEAVERNADGSVRRAKCQLTYDTETDMVEVLDLTTLNPVAVETPRANVIWWERAPEKKASPGKGHPKPREVIPSADPAA